MSIRLKLIGALAPPLVVLAAVTLVEVSGALGEISAVRRQTELADASLGPLSLLNGLERERNAASINLLGLEGAVTLEVEDNGEARAQTDDAATDLRDQIGELDATVQGHYAAAFESLDSLTATRQLIDAFQGERTLANVDLSNQVFQEYSTVIEDLYGANQLVAWSITDPSVRQGAELALLSSRHADLIARVVRSVMLAEIAGEAPDGVNEPPEVADLAALLRRMRVNLEQLEAAGSGEYQPFVEALLTAPETADLPGLLDRTLATGDAELGELLATATGGEGESANTVFRQEVADTLGDDVRQRESDVSSRARTLAAVAVTATLLALAATVLVARSITRPLDVLTGRAADLAHRQLPQSVRTILDTPLGQDVQVPETRPVQLAASGEVLEVAGALSTVQDTAVGLAVEQAVLRRNIADSFLNMGRRNQNLLSRQLEFITELESGETDPDTLANLFRLDHLATRMRRNAESLLVLAGVEPPRRWAQPVPVLDVIRSALGEVENFQRVAAPSVAPVSVVGAAASDLAHVLAELIENALSFSAGEATVEVRGAAIGPGYRLAVIDHGAGMAPADLERANLRLSGAESFTVAPSSYLGHYVAGQLAARHRVVLRLEPSPGQGVTAVADLPPELVVQPVDGWAREVPGGGPFSGGDGRVGGVP